MDFLREWFLGVAGAAMVGVFVMAVTPHGAVKRVVQIASALVLVIAVLRPFVGIGGFPGLRAEELIPSVDAAEIETSTEEVLSSIIAGQTSAYIVTKAQALGLAVSVTAHCRIGEFYPEPWSASILSERPEHAKSALEKLIEEDLGIPPERQEYKETNLMREQKGVEP